MTGSHDKPIALVTGASSGIGAVYADRFARLGHDLILVGRDTDRLDREAFRIRGQHGAAVEVMAADLASRAGIEIVEARAGAGDIDILVNNAGVATPARFEAASVADLVDTIAVNVEAATRLARAVLPAMIARDRGAVINIASVVALMNDRPGISVVYNASKAFLLSLSEGVNAELAGTGVRIQTVLPGPTRTPIWARTGIDVDAMLGEAVMDVETLVDAAIAGYERGETVTIPTLADAADWHAFVAQRQSLYPGLSGSRAADRYG